MNRTNHRFAMLVLGAAVVAASSWNSTPELRILAAENAPSSKVAEPAKVSPNAISPIHDLSEFGSLEKSADVQAAYEKAVETLRTTGGLLVIPSAAFKQIKPVPLQGLIRTPQPPAETKQWQTGAGVTIVSADAQQTIIQLPPLSGAKIERRVDLAEGDSLPHWGTHPALTIESKLVAGSVSYLDWIQEPVEKGLDRRFYVPTVRGLRPGAFVNIHGHSGYGGGVTRACIKSLGYDAEKKLHYVVADTSMDHKAGAIMHNKSNTGLVHMTQTSNNDNQTYDMKIIRNQYAHGDTYMYYADFNYMSNVHSAAGDENGNVYAAFIRSKENNFKGKVESVDWANFALTFAGAGAANVDTLGDSRPLINRNPEKALTAGKVIIVPPNDRHRSTAPAPTFEGKQYPAYIGKHDKFNFPELKFGGLIRGDKDAPWTADVVGRFFAVNTPEEKTPTGNLRWYEISGFKLNDDGTKEIQILRYWWGAKSAGSPQLYQQESYTWDGHVKPLDYIIAPGTYVNDVSRALPGGTRGGKRTLGLAPHRDQGTNLDFAAGDAVEQAIGPDPFKPQAFRCWMWEDVPGQFPSAVFDIANNGAASRYAVLNVRGGAATLEEVAKRKEQRPSWDNFLVLEAAATTGLNFKADFADAAVHFHQPTHDAAMKWNYGATETEPAKEAVLTVSHTSGELNFAGNGVRTNGPISGATGLSGDATPAKNLRGKNVAVAVDAKSVRITFPQPEADGDYAVFLEQSWLSERAVSQKGPDGFTVTFAVAAPADAKLDWMLVR